jgi:hypothetical protein
MAERLHKMFSYCDYFVNIYDKTTFNFCIYFGLSDVERCVTFGPSLISSSLSVLIVYVALFIFTCLITCRIYRSYKRERKKHWIRSRSVTVSNSSVFCATVLFDLTSCRFRDWYLIVRRRPAVKSVTLNYYLCSFWRNVLSEPVLSTTRWYRFTALQMSNDKSHIAVTM